MICAKSLIFSTVLLASVTLVSSKLNDSANQVLVGFSAPKNPSKLQTAEKETLKTFFDNSVKSVEELFGKFKKFVDTNGTEEDKQYVSDEEKALKEEVKAFNDKYKNGRHAWTVGQYYDFFTDSEERVPGLYEHVSNVKQVANQIQEASEKPEVKREYEVNSVQGKVMFEYPFVKELVKLAADRYDEGDYVSRVNEGFEEYKLLKKKIGEITTKQQSISAVKKYDESSVKKVLDEYKEFEDLVYDCKVNALDLYERAKKQLEVLSKDSSMTFFERNVSGFPRGSNAFLNIISSRILLLVITLYAFANL